MKELALTKQVCQLDKYGCFVGTTTADLDPIEKDHYLLPSGSVDTVFPKEKQGYVAKWENGKWVYIEDHRKEMVYNIENGALVIIEAPGALPQNVTTEPRPSDYHVFSNGRWVMTEEKEQQKLNDEEIEKRNKINQLLNHAAQKISEYKDLIDFADNDSETAAGEAGYQAWRQYRAALVKYQKGLVADMPIIPE